jgi:hypothetical protein
MRAKRHIETRFTGRRLKLVTDAGGGQSSR